MARTLVFLLVLLCSSASLVTCSSGAGLHMKLTHVDDKAGYTTEERVRRAVAVSQERLASTQQQQRGAFGDVSAPVHLATLQYIDEYLIGDPPQREEALIDTGSDLIWTQCATTCFKSCVKLAERDRFMHGQHEAVRSQPLAPLRPGRQLHVHRRFQPPALPPISTTTALPATCSSARRRRRDVHAVREEPQRLPLQHVLLPPFGGDHGGVGKTKLPIPSAAFELRQIVTGFWSGGVIIDTGSPFTSLADAAYGPLRKELARQLNRSLLQPPADSGLDLCVARNDFDKLVPVMLFHFSGGADMAVPPGSYWAPVDKSTACMMIEEGGDESIIGNFQQQDMHLLYDIGKGELSFQTADCGALI